MKLFILLVMLVLTLHVQAWKEEQTRSPVVLRYCDVANDPTRFKDKEIQLRAVYRVGFEWAEFYSLECIDAPSTWVEFSDEVEECSLSRELKKLKGGDAGVTAGVVVRGRFTHTNEHVGHMNGYANEFVVDCVESVQVLAKNSPHRKSVSEVLRRRIEQFEREVR